MPPSFVRRSTDHEPAEYNENANSDKTRKHNIYARIDRPDGIITFEEPETAESILTEWADGIDEMLKVSWRGTCD